MNDEITIPMIYWGGHPDVTRKKLGNFEAADRDLLQKWAHFFSGGPAMSCEPWLNYQTNETTWLDVPSHDGLRRLFLKPFYISDSGTRPFWYFAGFAIPTKNDPTIWGAAIRRLAGITRAEVEATVAPIRVSASPSEAAPAQTLNHKVFREDYTAALTQLCAAASACTPDELRTIKVASHPHSENPEFTSLIIARGFCYPGIGICSPKKPEEEAKNSDSTTNRKQKLSPQRWVHDVVEGGRVVKVKLHSAWKSHNPWCMLVLAVFSFAISGSFLARRCHARRSQSETNQPAGPYNLPVPTSADPLAYGTEILELRSEIAALELRVKQLEQQSQNQ